MNPLCIIAYKRCLLAAALKFVQFGQVIYSFLPCRIKANGIVKILSRLLVVFDILMSQADLDVDFITFWIKRKRPFKTLNCSGRICLTQKCHTEIIIHLPIIVPFC